MTGSDADILCGEWDSNGNTDPSTSGERFNIALTIKEIVRHPDYRNNLDNEQSYLQNDIAIFKVDENVLSKVTVSFRPHQRIDGTILFYCLRSRPIYLNVVSQSVSHVTLMAYIESGL